MTTTFAGLPDGVAALEEIKAKPQWVTWKYEIRNGRKTKPPVDPNTGGYASVSNPSTWATYERAAEFARQENMAGVGYVLASGDGYTGIDLDDCIGPDGRMADWAQFVVDAFAETYTEISPSGRGLRMIARGDLDKATKHVPAGVEMYGAGRYLTITGRHIPGTPTDIHPAPFTISALRDRVASMKPEAATETVQAAERTDFVGRVNSLAMQRLGDWVPEIFPAAQYHGSTGGYRVSSGDLGRDLEEDLSITPKGIVDFGLHDMGDPREGKRTAIDIVLEYGEQPDEKTAALWLCDRLGQAPEKIGYATASDEFGAIGDDDEDQIATIPASSFARLEKPERKFVVKDLIPDRNVTILNGDGATGKSLLAMQLGISVAAGTRWLGMEVEHGPVIYLSAEDDADENHIRVKDICAGEKIDVERLRLLEIAVMAGENCLLAIESDKSSSVLLKTKLFRKLRNKMAAVRPTLVILDNLADIFGGNENVKSLARQFIGMLRGLAIEFECAVLLLAHPSLSGMASGSGSSGNVAWNNSVRSRLYLQRDKDSEGVEIDPNRRFLETKKANYAGIGTQIDMRWEAGRFVADGPPDMSELDGMETPEDKTARAQRVFMKMVERFNREGRAISPSKGANYAPTLFAEHPRHEGVQKRFFEIAMNLLLEQGAIMVEMIGPPSRQQKNITLARETSD